ncbi:FAD-binding domain-containing protein [Phanerochaete sordida]|uniref:FAD-binding domain-containing protein n=1 Tax=Phanerochaete sordida TaxID=48140 RepID=A0A9P3LG19_9APHY|nr:FAD-binding domain-containing protein [Phanerochaete sordida]
MLHNDHTNGNGHAEEILTYNRLKQQLEVQYQHDQRLKPLLDLLAAVEAPEVDYYSPEVQGIIDEMRAQNAVAAPAAAKPEYKVIPFFKKVQEDIEHVETKVETFVDHVEGKVETHIETVEEKLWGAPTVTLAEIGDPTVEQVLGMDDFKNWGQNVTFRASHQLVVRSVEGVRKVVKWAAAKGKRVRVAGFRHSWSEVFGRNGDVLIMFLPFDTLVTLPYQNPPEDWKTELSGITPVASVAGRTAPAGHAFFQIMAGTTNEQFREWCFAHKTHCLPFNVIMVEVTFGGTNAPICHGSSLSSTTLSDLVVAVEYVDAHGELRVVDDPAELRAASGAFGLLGVVVALTLQLENMGVTDMMPVKVPMPLAIPPPPGFELPQEVRQMITEKKITEAQFAEAQKEFERRCETDYYLEWFWFPYQDDCWVNTWSKRPATDKDVNLQAYPGDGLLDGVKSQQIQETLAETLVNFLPFIALPGRLQAFLFGAAGLLALPSITDPAQAIRTLQSEAEHFRRGIQNFRCWDTEWEIPVPTVNGKPKYELIQRAWWDGIAAMYSRGDAPVRVALEMRLTGGSDVLLAPQRGNAATCSIEVLTTLVTPPEQWASFMQTVADRWTGYDVRDERGRVLHARPHWAKQWKGLTVRGKPVEQYLKEDAYVEAFAEFRQVFKGIVERNHATVEETLKVFGNDLMVKLIFE